MYNDTSNTNKFIAFKNPFRYRSYYYDFETGLYYLNSRYYDSELGRFINADVIAIIDKTNSVVNGLNLFTYCSNNPIMYTDKNGYIDWGKIFGWVATAVTAVLAVAAIVVVAAGVVASGGLLASVLVGAGVGALASMTGSIIAQGGFSNADPWQIFKVGLIGGTIGALTGVASWTVGSIGSAMGQQFGFSLSETIHLSSGIKFGKVFSSLFLMKTGKIVGNIVGGLIGGTISNYIVSRFSGNNLNMDDTVKQGILGELPSWIINLFRWMVA